MKRKYDVNARAYLESIAYGRGLDVGCADNPIGLSIGVDIDPGVKPSICSDMGNIPVGDCSKDYIVSSHCLEHSSDPIKVLEEWYRIIRPGGRIGIAVPHGEYVSSKTLGCSRTGEYVGEGHRQLFTEITLEKYMLYVGFRKVRTFKVKRPYAWKQHPAIVGLGIK